MTVFSDLLALGAAISWAASGLISASPSKHLGATAFVRWRMTLVLAVLWPCALLFSNFPVLAWETWGVLALSGLVGISFGDTMLFAAMNRLGPRRTGILFASHALFSALLGYWFFNERLGFFAYIGALLCVLGVMIAIAWGQHKNVSHEWETTPTSYIGVSCALLAALGQALGALIAKPVMADNAGFDPILASSIRITACAIFLWAWRISQHKPSRSKNSMNSQIFIETIASGLVGMVIGMGLLLWALKDGAVGSVGVLSGLAPVMILPLLWLKFKQAPALSAWFGALCACVGTALLLLRD